MANNNCKTCGASDVSSICPYCGTMNAAPAGLSEELEALRQLSAAAARVASATTGDKESVGLFGSREVKGTRASNVDERLAEFWASAYIPSHPDALLNVVNTALAGITVPSLFAFRTPPSRVSQALLTRARAAVDALAMIAPGDTRVPAARTRLQEVARQLDTAQKKHLAGKVLVYGSPIWAFLWCAGIGHCAANDVRETASQQAAAPAPVLTACDKASGVWISEVSADVGWNRGSGRPTKALVVEDRSIKVWATSSTTEVTSDGWVAWSTKQPAVKDGSCVFEVRDVVYGEGFKNPNGPPPPAGKLSATGPRPYDVVRTVTLSHSNDGVEMAITYDPPVVEWNGPDKATIESWFKALNGSFWKSASYDLRESMEEAASRAAEPPAAPAAAPASP